MAYFKDYRHMVLSKLNEGYSIRELAEDYSQQTKKELQYLNDILN